MPGLPPIPEKDPRKRPGFPTPAPPLPSHLSLPSALPHLASFPRKRNPSIGPFQEGPGLWRGQHGEPLPTGVYGYGGMYQVLRHGFPRKRESWGGGVPT